MVRTGPNDTDAPFGLIVCFFFSFLRKFLIPTTLFGSNEEESGSSHDVELMRSAESDVDLSPDEDNDDNDTASGKCDFTYMSYIRSVSTQ